MRLQVDWEVCQGHGKCYLIAPRLFAPDENDDWGKPLVLVPEIDRDDETNLAQARVAIASCPEYAITLQEGRSP